MRPKSPTTPALWLAICAAALSPTALAQHFTSSNLQLLHGFEFDDRYTGANTGSGSLTTASFENFAARSWGDSFFFIDLNHGRLVDFVGARRSRSNLLYAEWQPRFSLNRWREQATNGGLIRDVLIATQVNASDDGFRATLIGVGVDFNLPGFNVFGTNLYWRNDNFNDATAQLTTFWSANLGAAESAWSTEGFIDIAGTDNVGTDVIFQPRLLHDVGRLTGATGQWFAGIEWYYHHNDALATSAPQLMLKWVLP
ncbi:MAG: hypothetical protein ACT4NL_06885 [Pseudomarimonas sp.]